MWLPTVFEATNKIVRDIIADKHGDPSRVYLAGQSMGGNGAWLYASANPGIFAGVMVVCGYTRHPKETEAVALVRLSLIPLVELVFPPFGCVIHHSTTSQPCPQPLYHPRLRMPTIIGRGPKPPSSNY